MCWWLFALQAMRRLLAYDLVEFALKAAQSQDHAAVVQQVRSQQTAGLDAVGLCGDAVLFRQHMPAHRLRPDYEFFLTSHARLAHNVALASRVHHHGVCRLTG